LPRILIYWIAARPLLLHQNIAYYLDGETPVLIDPVQEWRREFLDGASCLASTFKDWLISFQRISSGPRRRGGYLAQRLSKPKGCCIPKEQPTCRTVVLVRVLADLGSKLRSKPRPVCHTKDRVHVASDVGHPAGQQGTQGHFSPGHAVAPTLPCSITLTKGLFCGDALGFLADGMSDVPFPIGLSPFDPRPTCRHRQAGSTHPEVLLCPSRPGTEVDQLSARSRRYAWPSIHYPQRHQGGCGRQQISQQVLAYRRSAQQAELPVFARVGISGYIQYTPESQRHLLARPKGNCQGRLRWFAEHDIPSAYPDARSQLQKRALRLRRMPVIGYDLSAHRSRIRRGGQVGKDAETSDVSPSHLGPLTPRYGT